MSMRAPYGIRQLNGLNGSQAAVGFGARNIRSGKEWEAYWPLDQLKGTDPWMTQKNERIAVGKATDQTVEHMLGIVQDTLWQTQKIAQALKGNSLEATLRNIYDYFYQYYQYKTDNSQYEELRTPLRAFKDRQSGVDCDCYVVSISSILANMGITHFIRRAKYDSSVDFTHVYVVVPKDGAAIGSRGSYVVLDPVIHQYNYEWPDNETPPMYEDTMYQAGGLSGIFQEIDQLGIIQSVSLFTEPALPPPPPPRYTTQLPPSGYTTSSAGRPSVSAVPVNSAEEEEPEILPPPPPDNPGFTTQLPAEGYTTSSAPASFPSGSESKSPETKKLMTASILGDNPVRNIIMATAAVGLLSLLFADDDKEAPKPKKMNGPRKKSPTRKKNPKRKTGRTTGSKTTVITI